MGDGVAGVELVRREGAEGAALVGVADGVALGGHFLGQRRR